MGTSPKKTIHAVYDLKCHWVWIPKYRKTLLLDSIEKYLKEQFSEIMEKDESEILRVELMPNHVQLFVHTDPKWALGKRRQDGALIIV